MPARRRHPDGARRMHAVSRDARRGAGPRWSCRCAGPSARSRRSRAWPRRARPCSASCRAASIPTCASRAPRRCKTSASTAMPSAGSRWARGRLRCSTCWRWRRAVLPEDRPRYLMGVGTPDDMLAAIARGIDMFDCVMPTRSGRHCQAFTWDGRLNLRNARYAEDQSPLDAESACPAAQLFPRLSAPSGEVRRDARRHAASAGRMCISTRS